MGLLNEAIREHLELKRLRGADPSEVAREEQDALGRSTPREEGGALVGRDFDRDESRSAPEPRVFDGVERHPRPDLSFLSQETVELDMRAILEAESVEEGVSEAGSYGLLPTSAAPARGEVERSATSDDALEWEIPGEGKHNFDGGFREKDSSPSHRVFDVRRAPAEGVLSGETDSSGGAHDQEGLWLDRAPAPDLGVGW